MHQQEHNGPRLSPLIHAGLAGALRRAFRDNLRVRLTFSWPEEHTSDGYVAATITHCPMLLRRRDSIGGHTFSESQVIRVETTGRPKRVLWDARTAFGRGENEAVQA